MHMYVHTYMVIKSQNRKLCTYMYINVIHSIFVVVVPPVIVLHPYSQSVNLNQTAIFTCNATGYNISYQWITGSGSFPSKVTNTISNTLIIPNVRSTDNNNYACVVSNKAGEVSSKIAKLTVTGKCTYIRMYINAIYKCTVINGTMYH